MVDAGGLLVGCDAPVRWMLDDWIVSVCNAISLSVPHSSLESETIVHAVGAR